jgi:hypothetical protein
VRGRLAWNHVLRLSTPWIPVLILWQTRGLGSPVITHELLGSTTIVLAAEYVAQPDDHPVPRFLLGVVPLLESVVVMTAVSRTGNLLVVGWLMYSLASLGWALRALDEVSDRG